MIDTLKNGSGFSSVSLDTVSAVTVLTVTADCVRYIQNAECPNNTLHCNLEQYLACLCYCRTASVVDNFNAEYRIQNTERWIPTQQYTAMHCNLEQHLVCHDRPGVAPRKCCCRTPIRVLWTTSSIERTYARNTEHAE